MPQKVPTVEELATIAELAQEHQLGQSSIWKVIRRHDLTRYRLPGKGKTTYVRRADFERARLTPIVVTDTKIAA